MLLFNFLTAQKHVNFLTLTLTITILAISMTGCQIKPLYGTQSQIMHAKIKISKSNTRLEQIIRNHLVFLNNGASEKAEKTANYQLDLNVTSTVKNMFDKSVNNDFTAGYVTVSGTYKLIRISDGKMLGSATRYSSTQYNLPEQQFAKIRALQNSENKAGRELAEIIYTDIAAIISK